MTAVLFYTFAVLLVASALCVAFSREIVRTALALLFTLGSVGGLYFLLHAEFLAAVQLVVYAGGTLILIVFAVMLTTKSPLVRFDPARREVVLACLIAGTLLASLIASMRTVPDGPAIDAPAAYPVTALGSALLGDYLIPFELASVLLLVVMIGAAYIAKSTRAAGGGK